MPFGGIEIIVIAVIVLLLFGGSRIPKIARGLGSSVTEFRRGVRDKDEQEEQPGPKEIESSDEEPSRHPDDRA